MQHLAARLVQLEELVLLFNNPGQQLETRHLASLAALPALSVLTLQANFHSEACNFSAALGSCSGLRKLTVLPSEASAGLTDKHVASFAGAQNSIYVMSHAQCCDVLASSTAVLVYCQQSCMGALQFDVDC